MKKTPFLLFLLTFSLTSISAEAGENVPLSSLNLNMMTAGFGSVRADRSSSGKPISLKGKEYKGVGTHADSKMIIDLGGRGERFTALAGVDDNAGGPGTVTFRVTGDGKVLFDSGVVKAGEEPHKIDVSLKGVNKLVLEALAGPDGKNYDHADWADAVITMESGKPVAIPDATVIQAGTDDIGISLLVDKDNNVFQQYIGSETDTAGMFRHGASKNPAYPTINSTNDFQFWGEPALHAIHADGHMSTALKFQKSDTRQLDANTTLTTVTLKDPNYEFYVNLNYKSHKKLNVVEQWTEISHREPGNVTLTNFASAAMTFRSGDFRLTHFAGGWANEFSVYETRLTPGSKVIENKWGITSSNERQQHFMLAMDGEATETSGKVLAASLAWSGNYKLQFELTTDDKLVVTAGMNPWASAYTLAPGRKFTTPRLIYTFSDKGKGEASRRLHRWALAHGLRDGHTPLRTIFNNWEATGMNTSDKTIVPFFKPAHDLGFELFLLDDGWFGLPNKARVLGEWEPTPIMHPKGMSVLINEAGKAGIDFGLWVEMEMANPEARLVKSHPDWLLCEPDRPKHLQRGQYVLDLSNPEVQQFCISSFNKIIKDNPGISFVKWDCNSPFHNPYSKYLGKNQQHLWINYTLGLYRVFQETVKANPRLQMMLCSAGGARSDYGALKFFHEFWASDNTGPLNRVRIQWGYSHIFPAKAVGAHVTHWGNQPFKFAFDVAMSGTLGMDADPTKMSDEEKKITKRAVAAYKDKLRPVVQFGDLYRLVSPYETNRASLMYVSPEKRDKAVVFFYQTNDDQDGLTVKLQGLNPDANYVLEEVNIDSPDKAACAENGQTLSGRDLMEKGLRFNCSKRFDSAALYLQAR